MTQIQQIRAEIERLYCEEVEKYDTSQEIGAKRILDELSKFINSLPAEQPSEELEKEIEYYLITNRQYAGGDEEDSWGDDCIRDAIKHGDQWQKEQMLKSAIDGCYISRNKYTKKNVLNGFDIKCDAIQKFKDGDKVKIIIIKENEK